MENDIFEKNLNLLREEIKSAEFELKLERDNLEKTGMLLEEEKRVEKEIAADRSRIRASTEDIKLKEEKLQELKAQYDESVKKCFQLEKENENLKKEIQEAKKSQDDHVNLSLLMNLEMELASIREKHKNLSLANKCAKAFQDGELKSRMSISEAQLKEDIREVSQRFYEKINALDEKLNEMENCRLKPAQKKLQQLQETLAQYKAESKDLEMKNKNIEKEIMLLEKSLAA